MAEEAEEAEENVETVEGMVMFRNVTKSRDGCNNPPVFDKPRGQERRSGRIVVPLLRGDGRKRAWPTR